MISAFPSWLGQPGDAWPDSQMLGTTATSPSAARRPERLLKQDTVGYALRTPLVAALAEAIGLSALEDVLGDLPTVLINPLDLPDAPQSLHGHVQGGAT